MTKTSNQLKLIPHYCPNPICILHGGANDKFYVRNGFIKTNKAPFKNQRFKCKTCGIQFSQNTFSLDYRKRLPELSEIALHYTLNGMSNSSISRLLKVSEGTIRDRLKTTARESLYFEKLNTPNKINENVTYDGFETFTHSQYSPCYINTAVGSLSMFIYHNTFSPLNRKGRMTQEQKIKNKNLIIKFGLYPQSSVFDETKYILQNLSIKSSRNTLYTDEHKPYSLAIKSFDFKMQHIQISSKRKRNASNPLFPINHLHMCYRHFFSSLKRETISFQKHEAALLEKIQLMKIYRNFMSSKFVKKNKYDLLAHECSPAMYLGLADRILSFNDVFGIRKFNVKIQLDEKEKAFIQRDYPFSRQIIAT